MISEEELRHALMEARAVADHTSRCVRRKVGALLFDAGGHFLSYGANINPPGMPCNQGFCPRGKKSFDEVPAYSSYFDCTATHAEVTAVRLALGRLVPLVYVNTVRREYGRLRLRGGTLVVTDEPCDQCTAYLAPYRLNVYWPGGRALA